MKDYYKILGVKEDASPEEIRDHYVELAKRNHPDLKKSAKECGKMKEINEAYGVLKDSGARVDYDLQRSLRRAYLKRRGKNGSKKREHPRLVRRMAFSFSILILFVVFFLSGFFLWKRMNVPIQPSSVPHQQTLSIPATETDSEVRTKEAMPKADFPKRLEPLKKPEIISTRVKANSEQAAPSDKPPKEIEPPPPSVVQVRPEPVIESNPAPPPVVSKPEPLPAVSLKQEQTVSAVSISPEPPPAPKRVQLISPKPEPVIQTAVTPSPPLLAEDEVRQFLANYLDRYVRKDIQGFLSLFSPKAIQNGKDGLDKIEGIYLRFFDQSERLIYRLEDIKIVIGGAGAEVTGYYQVTQRLKNQKKEKLWKGNLCCVLAKEEGVLKIRSLDYRHQKD